jgi:histidinol dehydrogenase
MTVLPRVSWSALDPPARAAWIAGLRPAAPDTDVEAIIAAVRARGDAALRELTGRFDGPDLADPWVAPAEVEVARVEAPLAEALERAARAIRRYHADQLAALRPERHVRTFAGVRAWRRWTPLERIGAYVPGGRAAYASSVLMLGIPASLARVDEVIVATPPDREGRVSPAILVAARISGVDRILRAGGAQAVAALAYGTATVPAVDRIFGAGNAWVTAAKRAVSGSVAIDLPAGPSECIVFADDNADPELVALDLLAQAEHGPDSIAIVAATDATVLDAVDATLPGLAASLATGAVALEMLRTYGAAVLVGREEAVGLIDAIAAEHVSLQSRDAEELAARIRHAGAVFIGPWSPIAAGDYATGTNHVLPTGGAARSWSGVGVESFGRWIELQRLTPSGVRGIAPTVEAIAAAEGLPAHAASVRARAVRDADEVVADSTELLRRPEPVAPYPAEPSDELLAERAGIPVESIVRADMNTMGGGPLPATRSALRNFDPRRAVEYGDLAYTRLRAALGARLAVDPRRVVIGAGADELIRLVTTAVVGSGDAVVIPTPTFAMFGVEARIAGARVIEVPRRHPARRQDSEQIRDAAEREAARLVWTCTPNNPTGDAIPLDETRRLADGLPAIVCVDEVYIDFADGLASAIELQGELDNLLVLRSLAKSHGLAGARVGYLVVPESLAERFDAIRLPLSLSAPAEAAALAVLADESAARARRAEIIEARERLARALVALGCETLPSVTNFVAFRPPRDPQAVDEALLRCGVAVRRYEVGPMAGWLRATARLGAEEVRLLTALNEVLR